jgi:hypothetical protein
VGAPTNGSLPEMDILGSHFEVFVRFEATTALVPRKGSMFPKPLVPVQVRAGAPLREREPRNSASVFGIFEWASFGKAGTLPGLSKALKG